MRITALYRLNQLVDNVRWRFLVWITHSKIDDVFSPRSRILLQRIGDTEDIGRQPLYSGEIVHH